VPQLTITVVPDSGTGQLVGLAGRMEIKITDGKHSYELGVHARRHSVKIPPTPRGRAVSEAWRAQRVWSVATLR